MPFSQLKIKAIVDILGAKVTQPCPSCNQLGKRTVVPELFVFVSHPIRTGPPPAPPYLSLVPPYPANPLAGLGPSLGGTGQVAAPPSLPEPIFSAPCVMLVC